MKKALFYTFLAIFVATAVVTLLGIAGILDIRETYLDKLFYALIVELVGSVIGVFRRASFFSGPARLSLVLLPKESFGRQAGPYVCKIYVYNQDTDGEREITPQLKRANGYLCAYLDGIQESELVKVRVVNGNNETWESEYFDAHVAKAEMQRT